MDRSSSQRKWPVSVISGFPLVAHHNVSGSEIRPYRSLGCGLSSAMPRFGAGFGRFRTIQTMGGDGRDTAEWPLPPGINLDSIYGVSNGPSVNGGVATDPPLMEGVDGPSTDPRIALSDFVLVRPESCGFQPFNIP